MEYKTIIHIDDDEDDLDFFAMAISEITAAATCFSFTDAATALQKLVSSEIIPDIIFLDLNMPIMNGQEFLLKIKANKILNPIPVIILSTSSDSRTFTELKIYGASAFITKPSGIKELINLLSPYLI